MVALALAGVAAITAVAFGVKAIVGYTKNDLKTINPSFEVGSLGSDGKYVADEGSLYTKEAFPAVGLQVKPDFDSTVDYQIFFYDDLDNFIESTSVLLESYSGGNHDAFARLVIIPRDDEDEKISWTEKITYPGQIAIRVSKTQDVQYYDILKTHMRKVVNVSDLLFVRGDISTDIDGQLYVDFDHHDKEIRCVTSRQVLAVKGGSTILNTYSSETEKGAVGILQYKEDNGKLSFICRSSSIESSVVLEEDTEFIVLVGGIQRISDSGYVELSDFQVNNFASYIQLTKSK